MTNYSLPTYNFIQLILCFVSDSTATLPIRSYANSITRHPSVVWCSRSISAMVTHTVFQIDILKYQNVCFSSSLNSLDFKRYQLMSLKYEIESQREHSNWYINLRLLLEQDIDIELFKVMNTLHMLQ
ncbi:Hypothetical_protein [Hexamita inflata]|uniref:Hypothetical_protein n=1 Tax=Hexamita inflata TaxID=28002 RepID=A0AA86UMW4_9EUKA|nr:Hypothetical protein HINF_LOCUS45196 [Hexamita inflata]